MKNLKRVLSLALSTAMVLGMMVIGSGAVSAEVEKAYNNDVAVATVKVLGIMEGDENGNFNGDKVVTRNEMAVVMANLADLKLNGAHPFSDVPAWADKYVAALYTNGLTSGTSATTYGGSEDITTTQAALMILKTLGYFEYQGEFGEDWELATVKRATEKHLFEDVDAGIKEGLTRTELAQMIYNALDCRVVIMEEESGMSVEGNGITVTQKPQYDDSRTQYTTLLKKLTNGNKVYVGDLEANQTARDPYDRMGVKIEYKDEKVKVFRSADKVLVNTDDEILTVKDLLEDLDIEYDNVASFNYAIAEGSVVELFERMDDEDFLADVIVYDYAAIQIDEVKECDEDDDEKWIEAGAEYKFETVDGDEYYDIQIDGFDAKTFVDDAWIVVPVLDEVNGEIIVPTDPKGVEVDKKDKDVYYGFEIAETVSGEVKTTKDNTIRLADGTKYTDLVGVVDENNDPVAAGDEWTLVLDANGYVVGGELVEADGVVLDDVYVWADTAYDTDKWNKTVEIAVLVDMKGEITEVQIDTGADRMDGVDGVEASEGDLVVIEENDDDKNVLVVWDNLDDLNTTDKTEGDYVEYDITGEKLDKDTKRLDLTDGTIRLNAETVYVMVGGEEDDIEATVKTGGVKFDTVAGNTALAITKEGKSEALYVIIVDTNEIKENLDEDAFFVVDATDYATSKKYVEMEVIFKNGEQKEIQIAKNEESKLSDLAWFEYEIDDDGYYTITGQASYLSSFDGATWNEEEGIINQATVLADALYGDLLTVNTTMADINVENAKFIDAHDKDAVVDDVDDEGNPIEVPTQWTKDINSLTKLCSLLDDEKIASATVEVVVDEDDGATLIILTSAF